MRRKVLLFVACFGCVSMAQRPPESDEALLAKTRALYDAPFTRDLVSFDCAVQFDWKKHFAEFTETLSPAAISTSERLQGIQHRVFIDRSGATVSAQPKAPDLSGDKAAAQLEMVLNAMVTQGLNAWLPFSSNVILPVGPTKYKFEKLDSGYKLTMNGPGIDATILLDSDLRVTSGVVQPPQDLRFATEFGPGPDGLLLASVKTGSTTGDTNGEARFAYTYQTMQGFQLPLEVNVSPTTTEPWHYALADCKVVKSITIHVAPPPGVAH
jgi:hypothetical protein